MLDTNSKKKIVLIVDKYPFSAGGMETHAYEFIKFFKEQDEYSLFCIGFSSEVSTPTLRCIEKNTQGVPLLLFAESEIYRAEGVIKKLLELRVAPEDLIFFNSFYWIRIFPNIKERFPGTKVILRSGGNDLAQSNIIGKGETLTQRRSFVINCINENVDIFIVNSHYSQKKALGYGVLPKIIHRVVGGVDTDRFSPCSLEAKRVVKEALGLPNKKIILNTGRYVGWKGISHSLEALSTINTHDFCYVLVGSGPEKRKIIEKVIKLGLEDKVILRDSVPIDQVHVYYMAADIYLSTPRTFLTQVHGGSYYHTETMGRSFCEALSTGLPVVGTRVGGVSDIVSHDATGYLVKEGDIDAIARSVIVLLTNSSMYEKMSSAGRRVALKNFSWKDSVFNYYLIIFNL